jgi:hypothetical protein
MAVDWDAIRMLAISQAAQYAIGAGCFLVLVGVVARYQDRKYRDARKDKQKSEKRARRDARYATQPPPYTGPKVLGLALALLVGGCASAPTTSQRWALTIEKPIARVCLAPCDVIVRLAQTAGEPACPHVTWSVQTDAGYEAFHQTREADCDPGDPSPRFRFEGTFMRGLWIVFAQVKVLGQLVAEPWKEVDVR